MWLLWFQRNWVTLAVIALLGVTHFAAYHHGVTVTDNKWQAEQAGASAARATQESDARTEDNRRQVNTATEAQNAQPKIDAAHADAHDLAALAVGLRQPIDVLATRACGPASNPRTAGTSEAATHAAMVLSDLLKRDQARLAELAPAYDESVARGLACQRIYDGLSKH